MRHIFIIGPAFMLAMVMVGGFFGHIGQQRPVKAISREEFIRQQQPKPWVNALSFAMIAWGESGAVYFLIDAMRRKYRGGRPVAVALALMGLISGGMTSVLYYAFWGRRPLEPESAVFGNAFCPQCLSRTSASAAPGALAFNVVFGTRYMGSADRCAECKSVVRTLWVWCILPIFSAGSYRIVSLDTTHFVGRKTPLRWSHVATVYGIAGAVVAIVLIVRAVYS